MSKKINAIDIFIINIICCIKNMRSFKYDLRIGFGETLLVWI